MPVAKLMGFSIASLMDRMGVIGCGINLEELENLLPPESKFQMDPVLDPGVWWNKK
jgi:hypothetical protein